MTVIPTQQMIRDLETSQRPRERLETLGPTALTNAELIAILLRTGIRGESAIQVAQRLLFEFGGLSGLQSASFQSIANSRGMGRAKASQLKAAVELGYRLALQTPLERPLIQKPADAADLVKLEMSGLAQENLWVMVLDTRNRLLYTEHLYIGSVNASSVRVGEVFRAAIERNGASIIVLHNHPSGDPSPSPEDIALTRALIQAGKLLDIELLDHLVIGGNNWVSLKDRGLAFGG